MQDLVKPLSEFFTGPMLANTVRAALLLVAGAALARLCGRALERVMKKRASPQQAALVRRLTAYAIFGLSVVTALRQLGFELTALLGAAGVVTVAVGFAAQTSASNLISGLFLMGERSFGVGDIVRVGTTMGEVISIDMLSVKLRTFDNLLVRLPNEMLVKSEITTLSHFPIRRIDIPIGCAYHEDVERVRATLLEVAGRIATCLEEPAPLFMVTGYGDNAVQILFCAWTAQETFLETRNALFVEIKRSFDERGLEFPFPQRTLHHQGSLVTLAKEPVRQKAQAS